MLTRTAKSEARRLALSRATRNEPESGRVRGAVPWRLRRWGAQTKLGIPLVLAALLIVVMAVLEGDLTDVVGGTGHRIVTGLSRFGPGAPFGLLLLEEAGVPVLVPGDVLIMVVAHRLPHAAVAWSLAWAALVACAVVGASILYLLARRWGRQLASGRVGALLHLTPARLSQAERWFHRWGPWAIIFGRHIFGLRIPITVAAGIFRVPYPVFGASVAVSSAVWVGAFLLLGAKLSGPVARYLQVHHQTALLLPLLFPVMVAGYIAFHVLQARRHNATIM